MHWETVSFLFICFPAVGKTVTRTDKNAANKITYSDRQKIFDEKAKERSPLPAYWQFQIEHHARRNKIHIGNAVLKTAKDKESHGENNRYDFIACFIWRKAHPYGYTNKNIA